MKKFFIAFLILAVTAANVFAEITFSGEAVGTWTVVGGEGGKKGDLTGQPPSTTDAADDLGHGLYDESNFKAVAINDDATWGGQFKLKALFAAASPAVAPLALETFVWWQPIKQVKATFGNVGTWRPFTIHEDVFTGVGVRGVGLQLYPIDPVQIAFGLPVAKASKWEGLESSEDADGKRIKNDYHTFEAFAAYSLANIADFGFGYVGAEEYSSGSELNLGVAVTAIKDVTLQLGVFYYIPETKKNATGETTIQKPLKVKVKAGYKAGAFDIGANLNLTFLGSTTIKQPGQADVKSEGGFTFEIVAKPSYTLDIGKLGADITFGITTAQKFADKSAKDDTLILKAKPYFEKTYGGGTVNIAFDLALTNFTADNEKELPFIDDGYGYLKWSVPIKLKYVY
jgi:hypothetical protein